MKLTITLPFDRAVALVHSVIRDTYFETDVHTNDLPASVRVKHLNYLVDEFLPQLLSACSGDDFVDRFKSITELVSDIEYYRNRLHGEIKNQVGE